MASEVPVPVVASTISRLEPEFLKYDKNNSDDKIVLGSGSYGVVYQGKYKGRPVAVKSIHPQSTFDPREVELQVGLDTEFTVEVLGLLVESPQNSLGAPSYYIVTELLDGCLNSLVLRRDAKVLRHTPPRERLEWLLQVANGLLDMHTRGVIHLDIAPGNILLKCEAPSTLAGSPPRARAKISDFGFARVYRSSMSSIPTSGKGVKGTLVYMDPRLYNPDANATTGSDIYSFAMVAWQLLTLQTPFSELLGRVPSDAARVVALQKAVQDEGERPQLDELYKVLPAAVAAQIKSLLSACWSADDELRPRAQVVVDTLRSIASEWDASNGWITQLYIQNDAAAITRVLRDIYGWIIDSSVRQQLLQEAGIVNCIFNLLRLYFGDVGVVTASCLLLSASLNVDVSAGLLVDVSLMEYLMRAYPLDTDINHSICSILLKCCRNAENRIAFCAAGGIPQLMSIFRHHIESAAMMEVACGVVWSCCDDADNRVAFQEAGGIPYLVSVLARHLESEAVMTTACGAVARCCVNEDSRITFCMSGGIPLLVHVLARHLPSADVMQQACAAVWSCSFNEQPEAFREAGIIPHLVSVLSHHVVLASVMEQACSAVANCCWDSDMRVAFFKAGGTPHLVAVIAHHLESAVVLEKAYAAVWRCTVNSDISIAFRRAGGIPQLVSVLAGHLKSEAVTKEACAAVFTCCILPDNELAFVAAGGIACVIAVLAGYVESAAVMETACGAVVNCCNRTDHAVTIREAGGIQLLVAVLTRHVESALVMRPACTAIANCCVMAEDNRISFYEAGGIPRLVSVLERHHENATVTEDACVALSVCCGYRYSRVAFREAGGIPHLISVFFHHLESAGVMEAACMAVRSCCDNNDNRETFREAGGDDIMRAVIARHPSLRGSLREGPQVIRMLSSLLGVLFS